MAQKKEYRSAIRSRRMIRQAFLDLLRQKVFEKITVTDIVKRADINRSTFYAHYPDVLGLVEEMMAEVIDNSLQLVANLDIQDIFHDPIPFLQGLITLGEENLEIYKLLDKSDFALRQIEKMKFLLIQKSMTAVGIPESIRQNTAFRIQVNFFIGGILSTYQQWMQGNLNCSTDEIVQQMANLIIQTGKFYPLCGESSDPS